MKTSQTLALEKSEQKIVATKAKKLRGKIKSGKIVVRQKPKKFKKVKDVESRGLIYIGHLPHGFYEEEIMKYFKQFGRVTNAKVCRSRKNGNSKGFGYVEFLHADVAKVAAETMNNYVMFKKKIVAEFVPYEKRPKAIFIGHQSTPTKFSSKRKWKRQERSKNVVIDESEHIRKSQIRLTRLQQRLAKIKKLGIDYDLKPVDVPKELAK